jgi:hypothetical protein
MELDLPSIVFEYESICISNWSKFRLNQNLVSYFESNKQDLQYFNEVKAVISHYLIEMSLVGTKIYKFSSSIDLFSGSDRFSKNRYRDSLKFWLKTMFFHA